MFKLTFFILLVYASTVFAEVKVNEKAVEIAKSYSFVRELKNDNRSPEIDKWHKVFGLPFGNPYCAMFTLYCYIEAFNSYNKKSPLPKIARVSTFSKWSINNPLIIKTITAKQILFGVYKLETGDIISWKHGRMSKGVDTFNWNGHMGLVISSQENNIFTIEGNTKPSDKGDQTGRVKEDIKYGNDGVYSRVRKINPWSNFSIVYFHRLQKRTIL